MHITMLGHAGLRVDGRHSTVLLDPWLSPYGAYQASWFQYPDNSHLLATDLWNPTAVALSHEHLDHLDPWFLAKLDPSVPVVAPRFPSSVIRRKVLSSGPREVVELEPGEWFDIGNDMQLKFLLERSPMNHDSGIVVRCGDSVLLDMNDARLTPAQLRGVAAESGGHVSALALQGSGASWHPMVYRYADEHKRKLSRQKRMAKLAYVLRAVGAAQPEAVVPSAGPPCFLDSTLFE